MKRLVSTVVVLAICGIAQAQSVRVEGHVRKDGTYVPPHYRTAPDSSRMNNWSTEGNYNPHTGQAGTVSPYPQPYTPLSPQPRQNRNDPFYLP